MAEAHASIVSSFPVYAGRFAGAVMDEGQEVTRDRARKRETDEPNRREETQREAHAGLTETERRREYNREYMREWRKRNQERYRVYNRAYQRKRHIERKIASVLAAPAESGKLCGYGCGRPAVETIERIDPRTWKSVQIGYCGNC